MEKGTFKTTSGNIEIGDVKEAQIEATSGTLKAGNVQRVTANLHSGGIKINSIKEYCNLSATSGEVKIETCYLTENSNIMVKSGGVYIKEINDIFVNAKTNSGSTKIKETDRKAEVELKIQTTSGTIKVGNN